VKIYTQNRRVSPTDRHVHEWTSTARLINFLIETFFVITILLVLWNACKILGHLSEVSGIPAVNIYTVLWTKTRSSSPSPYQPLLKCSLTGTDHNWWIRVTICACERRCGNVWLWQPRLTHFKPQIIHDLITRTAEYQHKAQLHTYTSLILEDEGSTIPRDIGGQLPNDNATCKRTWNLNHTTMRTLNLAPLSESEHQKWEFNVMVCG